MRSQKEIFQDIADAVFSVIEEGWLEIIINYEIEGGRSKEVNTYIIKNIQGNIEEHLVPLVPELNRYLRELRDDLAQDDKPVFTGCKLHFKSDGYFSADYSYDAVD